ncbi:unnamed protein product [Caenorhabditis angaria]|uniref:Uncharacterized protein n=1 Tax=Caenorhabditis angaria TaxID=860376 RepID=A0A9P1N919_9PELO|nr:unnamed protein product [Caenorhabditis angaria]
MLLKLALLFFIEVTSHEIFKLPGQNFNFDSKQFAGYLNVTDSKRMFYWLAESENNVTTDPLIFWFNGGPGCSSLTSLFLTGPFNIDSLGRVLSKSEYSFTKLGSIVYIESPSPVGFSYSTDHSDPFLDQMTAQDNYKAIKSFFQEYPQFKNHEVFLTGISYAGIYVPMLARKIIDNQRNFKINLKGIALGGPLLSEELRVKSGLEYSYSHGIIDEDVYRDILENCYNIYFLHHPELNVYQIDKKCEQSPDKSSPNSCGFKRDSIMESYFNQNETREILRIPDEVGKWERCRDLMYFPPSDDIDEHIKQAINNDVKVLLYFGDMDMVCPFSHGQRFVENLGIEEIENGLITRKDQEIIGKYTSYKNLDFMVFKNAGHYLGATYLESQFELHRNFFKYQKLNVL